MQIRKLIPTPHSTDYELENGTPLHSDWWMWLGRVFFHRITIRMAA